MFTVERLNKYFWSEGQGEGTMIETEKQKNERIMPMPIDI